MLPAEVTELVAAVGLAGAAELFVVRNFLVFGNSFWVWFEEKVLFRFSVQVLGVRLPGVRLLLRLPSRDVCVEVACSGTVCANPGHVFQIFHVVRGVPLESNFCTRSTSEL